MIQGKTEFDPRCDETGKVNYDLPPRGVSYGKPPQGLRNWNCRVDGDEDPDWTGSCKKEDLAPSCPWLFVNVPLTDLVAPGSKMQETPGKLARATML